MAELLQLDKAAALVGKSEVTLRRLIKSGKIPFQKEKTLTGFIYLVDANLVRNFYNVREELIEGQVPITEPATPRSGIRVAIAGESGSAYEYWQKKSELYEDRYHNELVKHSQTREDLGVWRGRAEQTQSMLMKLLPAPQEVEVQSNPEIIPPQQKSLNTTNTLLLIIAVVVMIALAVVGALYLKLINP